MVLKNYNIYNKLFLFALLIIVLIPFVSACTSSLHKTENVVYVPIDPCTTGLAAGEKSRISGEIPEMQRQLYALQIKIFDVEKTGVSNYYEEREKLEDLINANKADPKECYYEPEVQEKIAMIERKLAYLDNLHSLALEKHSLAVREYNENQEKKSHIKNYFKKNNYEEGKLLYREKNILVKVINIGRFEKKKQNLLDMNPDEFFIELTVSVERNKIIRPRTSKVFEYADDRGIIHTDSYPFGFKLFDNFGNEYGLTAVTPEMIGSPREKGIRPGEIGKFQVWFSDIPLEKSEFLILEVSVGTLGNLKHFNFKIPYSELKNYLS